MPVQADSEGDEIVKMNCLDLKKGELELPPISKVSYINKFS